MIYRLLILHYNKKDNRFRAEYRSDNIDRMEPDPNNPSRPNPVLGSFYFPASMTDTQALNMLRNAMLRTIYDDIDFLTQRYDSLYRFKP